jgi:hypothetical protein
MINELKFGDNLISPSNEVIRNINSLTERDKLNPLRVEDEIKLPLVTTARINSISNTQGYNGYYYGYECHMYMSGSIIKKIDGISLGIKLIPQDPRMWYFIDDIVSVKLSKADGNIFYSIISGGKEKCVCRINSVTAADTPARNRWKYNCTPMTRRKDATDGLGYGTTTNWVDATSYDTIEVYNLSEQLNSTGGLQGNGISVPEAPIGTFALKPIANLMTVWKEISWSSGDPTLQYWCEEYNAYDGDC